MLTLTMIAGLVLWLVLCSNLAPTAITGTLRPWILSSSLDLSAGFRRPKFSQFTVDLSSADADIQRKVDFEQDTLVQGLVIRTFDSSATARVDGLIRRVRVDVTLGGGGSRELIRATWGQLRSYLVHFRGYSDDDRTASVGIALVPLNDPRNTQGGGGFFFRKGDSFTIHLDTSSTAEADFTSVTPAAGDKCVCTILGYTIVRGQGDAGADSDIRQVSANRAARRPSILNRVRGV